MEPVEILDIIDEKNQIIGQTTKKEAYLRKLSHRTVHVMVCEGNTFFIPQRSMKVRYLPGYFCSSAAGHVRAAETSIDGALRELKEEIGLDGPIELIHEYFYQHEFPVHTSIFLKRINSKAEKIKLDPEEVGGGRFYKVEEFRALDSSRFHPQLGFCIDLIKDFL